jgi:UDP-N-acetylmuramoyl-tripeptide--D-alanyl-D-alanine ligase
MNWEFLIKDKESLLVSTDTRNLPAGCVFFALHGANFDGNKFASQALEQGASLAVIDDPEVYLQAQRSSSPQGDLQGAANLPRLLLVEDTLLALQDLARTWRRELGLPIIGITGTNGKTTTKELLATVLSTKYNLHYTQGNLNNQIGVPLTLLQITRAHEIAIVEMGASHPGDIKELVEIAEPNYGLITNVGRAHLEGFGSFEGVQRTKQELYDYLVAHQGTIFRNTDNPYLAQMENNSTQLYTTLHHSTQPYTTLHNSKPPQGRTAADVEKQLTDLILKAQNEHEEIILEVSDFRAGTEYGYNTQCPPELQMP